MADGMCIWNSRTLYVAFTLNKLLVSLKCCDILKNSVLNVILNVNVLVFKTFYVAG